MGRSVIKKLWRWTEMGKFELSMSNQSSQGKVMDDVSYNSCHISCVNTINIKTKATGFSLNNWYSLINVFLLYAQNLLLWQFCSTYFKHSWLPRKMSWKGFFGWSFALRPQAFFFFPLLKHWHNKWGSKMKTKRMLKYTLIIVFRI